LPFAINRKNALISRHQQGDRLSHIPPRNTAAKQRARLAEEWVDSRLAGKAKSHKHCAHKGESAMFNRRASERHRNMTRLLSVGWQRRTSHRVFSPFSLFALLALTNPSPLRHGPCIAGASNRKTRRPSVVLWKPCHGDEMLPSMKMVFTRILTERRKYCSTWKR
jgi:hypothetical protein